MKIGKKCINFHTFAIDNIRLSKTYPKSLKISHIARVRNCLDVTIHESLMYLGLGLGHGRRRRHVLGHSHGNGPCHGSRHGHGLSL